MPSSRRAVIDIGTNSIKLLLADVKGGAVAPLLEKSEQTRLGTGFYENHRLQPEPVARTAEAAARFAMEARQQGAKSFRIVATSAVRDAVNPEELLRAVAAATGVEVEVISGRREAELTFRGVTSDSSLPSGPLLVMDLGGGSTEFIVGHHGAKQFEGSFPLGTVRLLNQCAVADPPTTKEREECRRSVEEFLRAQVAPGVGAALASCPGGPPLLVGTGGTSTLLAVMHQGLREFNRAAIEAARMGAGDIESRLNQLWSLPLAARRELPGLPANRADVMLMGVVVYASVLRVFGLGEMRSSTRGLRHAVLLDEEVTA